MVPYELAVVSAWIGVVLGQVFQEASSTCPQATASCQGGAGPYGPLGAGTSFLTGSTGCTGTSTCLSADPVPLPLSEFYLKQPIYTRIVQYSTESLYIDNVCNTFVRVPDDEQTFIVYTTTVYIDGTSSTESFVISDLGGGNYMRANADFTIIERSPAVVGELLVSCTQLVFGESTYPSLLVTTFGSRPAISLSCVQKVQQAYNCAGLGSCESLYVLPYQLPSKCIQSTCSPAQPLGQDNKLFIFGSAGFDNNGRCYGNTC